MSQIPYDAIKAAALAHAPHLLAQWFPAGRVIGRQFVVGNLAGDPGQSLSISLATGKWKDFAASASGSNLVELRAQARYGGDFDAAAVEVGRDLGVHMNGHLKVAVPKPDIVTVNNVNGDKRPTDDWQPVIPPLGVAPPSDAMFRGFDIVHEYTTLDDKISHYVGRIEARANTRKRFVPVTYGCLNGALGWHNSMSRIPDLCMA